MKPGLLLLLVFLAAVASAQPSAKKIVLAGPWKLALDSTLRGVAERWYAPEFDRSAWMPVKVPGAWDDAGFARYDGVGWYATNFSFTPPMAGARARHAAPQHTAPRRDMSRRYALVFDAVDDNATVWLNGVEVGSHTGYGQRFFFDVTTLLHRGNNSLVVRIEDLAGPGGITGAVALQPYATGVEMLTSAYHDRAPVRSARWVKDAVVYEVYLRSFSREGTLKALEARLPELKALGATVVWLMPIHPVGVVKRKGKLGSPYSVRDYHAVNPEFGTLDDFRALVKTVHGLGMRIIIDLVANHTAWDNPLVAEHPEWYRMNDAGEIVSPNPDWTDVAALDYAQKGLRAWMTDMMAWWVRDVGIDGFRCDVAELVPTDFWRAARARLDAIKPVMMLAEGSLPEEHIGAFDATYAWNTYDVLGPIMAGKLAPAVLDGVLKEEYYRFPKGALRLRFSSNHDKNNADGPAVERYTPAGAAAAAVLMFTLPGIPLIYNGDEVGNPRRLSLFEKVAIPWARDTMRFRELYTRLCELRASLPALRSGGFTPLPARKGNDTLVYAFTRELKKQRVYIIINLSNQPQKYILDLNDVTGITHHLTQCEMRTGKNYVEFRLPSYGYWMGSNF